MMTELEKYYNKFNEEKRLKSRHGQVEFITSMKYIHKYLPKREHGQVKILDVGAGTGRYSVALAEEGYDVTAVELVKYNLGILKKKNSSVKAYQGNALKLSRFPDKEFDLIILFGPMYHLYTKEDKVKALMEVKRVLKDEGTILVAYTMNEYSVLVYGFRENHIQECLENGKLDANYRVCPSPEDLYDYVRLEDIDSYNEAAGMERLQIISADGPSDYMRQVLNTMDENEAGILIMIDGDNFKSINDNYGHMIGDEVIKLSAQMIVGRIRTVDLASRLHGDEFAIYVNNTDDYDVAKKIMIDINTSMEKEAKKRNMPSITLSAGAVIAKRNDDYLKLAKIADDALYEAKKTHNGSFHAAVE